MRPMRPARRRDVSSSSFAGVPTTSYSPLALSFTVRGFRFQVVIFLFHQVETGSVAGVDEEPCPDGGGSARPAVTVRLDESVRLGGGELHGACACVGRPLRDKEKRPGVRHAVLVLRLRPLSSPRDY